MCCVTVSVFGFNRQINSLVNIVNANYRKYRHHKLLLNKRVIKVGFAYNATNVVAYIYADFSKYNPCVAANALAVYNFADIALFIGFFNKDYLGKAVCLCRINHISAVFKHYRNKLVGNISESKYLFFGNAGKVVVERTAVDDVFRRFADIRRFVHECGRIARARADAPCGGCPID